MEAETVTGTLARAHLEPAASRLDRRLKYFLILLTLHSSLLITSTIAGAKVFALPFGLTASATVFSYMLTFVILDSVAEIYGRSHSRFVINLGLIGMGLSAAYFEFSIILPPAETWPHQEALRTILGASVRIWLAGWTAYMLSQYLDLWSFMKLREITGGRGSLVVRAWLSMVLAQLLDTIVFITIAFYGVVPIGGLILGQFLIKVAIATLASPLVPAAVALGRRWIGESDPGR
jgi:uncharacterized integral membrane protein (TIGR00697 family)